MATGISYEAYTEPELAQAGTAAQTQELTDAALGAARADTDENKNKNEMADKEATAGAGGELATTGNAAAAVAEPQPVAQADSKAIEATDAVGITKDATGDGAVDDDGSDDDDADGMEHDNAIVDNAADFDGSGSDDDDDDADYDMDDDLDDTVDASKMKWPCQECGCGTTLTPAVPCEGRLCLLRPARNVYAEDARALCYPCAGVTHATVGAAPPFICVRCFDAA